MSELICLSAWLRWQRAAAEWGGRLILSPHESLDLRVEGLLQETGFLEPRRYRSRGRRGGLAGPSISGQCELTAAAGPALIATMQVDVNLTCFEHSEASLDELEEIWRQIALAECMGFLVEELADHHLETRWAEEAQRSLAGLVELVPLAQAFYLCWIAVRDLASAYLKYPHARSGLGETLTQALRTKLARSQSEHWNLRAFNRHARTPASALGEVFGRVSQLGENYLYQVPHRQHLMRSLAMNPAQK